MVACVCTGTKYDPEYVDRLQRAVKLHLTLIPYEFVCITDREDLHGEGRTCVKPQNGWPGWWSKINLFDPAHYPEGTDRVLYLDLDCVVTGSLDGIASRAEPLTMISNFGPNWRHSPVNSSCMTFDPHDVHVQEIMIEFFMNPSKFMKELHGDQCFIWRSYGAELIARFTTEECISYKYHCRGKNLPKDARVVVFHGKPDPHEVGDGWVKTMWGFKL